ncbi:MAG: FtsX-like permease family protein, partial [Chrysiogenales bacterium]
FPEVVNAARYVPPFSGVLIRYRDKIIREQIGTADAAFFSMFTFPFVRGSAAKPFPDLHSLVITEEAARRIFGDEDPMGKTVTLENHTDFQVSGIVRDIPANSTIRFSALVPMEFLAKKNDRPNMIDTWYNCMFTTFVQLDAKASVEGFNRKISGLVKQNDPNSIITPFVVPFRDLYLHGVEGRGGHMAQVNMFSLIGVFILLLACINFMNLATARSEKRAREVGVRKVMGAERRQLILQFFGESLLLAFLSLVGSLMIVALLLPVFNMISDKTLSMGILVSLPILLGMIAITLFTGLISGSYPALLLSAAKPVSILKDHSRGGRRRTLFRKILVVGQFAVSVALIVSTVVISRQLHFLKSKDLGLNKEQIVYFPVNGALEKNHLAAKREFLNDPRILQMTRSSNLPTGIYQNGSGWMWEGQKPDEDPFVTYLSVDPDFLATYRVTMAAGRFFQPETQPGAQQVIVNEKMARLISDKSVLGKILWAQDDDDNGKIFRFTIVGVVKDFHFKPLDVPIEPLLMFPENPLWKFRFMSARISTENMPGTLSRMRKTFTRLNPGIPFEYRFLDQDYDQLYRSQEKLGTLINGLGALALFISCLGLYGLAAFMAEQKTKEIGIRKVLGASVAGIVGFFSREFIQCVLLANLIAWPLAYYFMNEWLRGFAYRINIGVGIFFISGLMALVIAMLAVGYQSIKAARANPVDSLRYE